MSTTNQNGVTVQALQIKNFLGIKELQFTPDGKFNFITGRNGAGKTSVLRAIQFAFEGKERGAENLDYIFNGEDKAEILVDLGKFQIRRGITAKTLSVDVTKDGFKAENPATLLKEMVGRFSFNPIDFAFCDEKERNEVVLNALGVEYSPEDAVKDGVYSADELKNDNEFNNLSGLALIEVLEKSYYSQRTEVNRGLESAKKSLDEARAQLPEDYAAFDQAAYDKTREAIENQREIIKKVESDQHETQADLDYCRALARDLSTALKKYGDDTVLCKIELVEKRVGEIKTEGEAAAKTMEKLQAQEAAQREAMQYAKLQAQIEDLEERVPKGEKMAAELTDKVTRLRGEIKERLIAGANIGIEGLAFTDGRFTVNGVPVENLSDSEKLRVGVKIAEKVAGKLDFIFIDGVERLDPETLKEFCDRLAASQFQYFFTTCHPAEVDGKKLAL